MSGGHVGGGAHIMSGGGAGRVALGGGGNRSMSGGTGHFRGMSADSGHFKSSGNSLQERQRTSQLLKARLE